MITIITAIKNGEKDVKNLIFSLNNQTSNKFKWLVIDSMSTDNSIDIIKKEAKFPFEIFSQLDFSIYHALNIAIRKVETEYYCVAGCDDSFFPSFIENFYSIIKKNKYDLILGSVASNGNIIAPFVKNKWLSPVNASHSVGTIIKTNIHKTVGLYSRMYPVVADKKLVVDIERVSNNIHYSEIVFGEYSQEGFSSVNKLDNICDLFRLQVFYKYNMFLQVLLLIFRLFKNITLKKSK